MVGISKIALNNTEYNLEDTSARTSIGNLSTVATSGSYNDLSNKPTIPTSISELINDSDFITSSDLDNKIQLVSVLPAEQVTGVLYVIPED